MSANNTLINFDNVIISETLYQMLNTKTTLHVVLFFLQNIINKSHIDLVVEEIVDDSVEPLLRVTHIWQLESKHETKPCSSKKMNRKDKTIRVCFEKKNSLLKAVLRIRDVYPGS